MSLEYNRLPPELLDEGIERMAEQHSKDAGETWEALPDAEIPLAVFAALLDLANDSHWENYEKTFHLDVERARSRGIDFTAAMRRREPASPGRKRHRDAYNCRNGRSPTATRGSMPQVSELSRRNHAILIAYHAALVAGTFAYQRLVATRLQQIQALINSETQAPNAKAYYPRPLITTPNAPPVGR